MSAWPTAREVQLDGYQLKPEVRTALAAKLSGVAAAADTPWLQSLREELESAELRCAELQQRLERAQSRDGGLPREDPGVPESTRDYPRLPEMTRRRRPCP